MRYRDSGYTTRPLAPPDDGRLRGQNHLKSIHTALRRRSSLIAADPDELLRLLAWGVVAVLALLFGYLSPLLAGLWRDALKKI